VSGADFDLALWISTLPLLLAAATLTWVLSLPLRNAGVVDPLWPLMLFAAGVVYALGSDPRAPRLSPVLWMCAIWAARMAWHRLRRTDGEPRRYRELRTLHQPHFALKSLYLLFWQRALCGWVVSLPLMGAFASNRPWGRLDTLGVTAWAVGLFFQTTADWQLRRFQSNPENSRAVLRTGLWQFSRHPPLFGEFCVWFGFFCMALAAGAWWALPATALMAGVLWRAASAQSPGGNSRPHYADYVLKTNAFFPGRRRD
jgi:steroid 5-alpha reductase family enzyme